MAPGKATDLEAEFAAWKGSDAVVRCFTCKSDPETREFIHRMKERGESLRSISRFLSTKGVRLTDGALKNHFDRGHHL